MDTLPISAIAGVTHGWHKLRVVDATTGEQIHGVREVDTAAGTLKRNEIDGNGNLVIADGQVSVIEETRDVRLEWLDKAEQLNALVPLLDAASGAGDQDPEA